MKIQQLLKNNPDIELLLANAIHKEKIFVISHPEYSLGSLEIGRFFYYLWQYKHGYSIAAITHHKEFFGLDFFVNKNVLIPRPETEMIVEEVLGILKKSTDKNLLIDIGTGSGCIPIAIAKNSPSPLDIIALDISKKALKLATKNIQKHNVKIRLICSDLLEKIFPADLATYTKIIITANLPYLTQEQLEDEPSIQKEPKVALVAAENGLALYRKTLDQIKNKINNKNLLILFEIDPSQEMSIQKIANEYLPQTTLEIKKDLAGLSRVLKITT